MKKQYITLTMIVWLVLSAGTIFPQNLTDVDQLMLDGHYSEALKIVESIVENDTSNAEAYYKGGLIYQNLLQHGKATQYLETAAGLAPEQTDIRYALGKNYYQLDRFEEARRAMQMVFRADSSHLSAGTHLGMILMKMNDFREADKVHLALLSQDETNAHAYKQLAISAFKQGDDSTSIAHTAKYLSKFERYSPVADPDIIYYSGKNDLRVGRVESAKHNFRWGIRNFPHRKVFHAELAKLLYG
ncbi:MAG: tetratricopeptide repeat protein, partial [Candidatus Marinimicrobia bacterium]|nr:tetratricopeptide repeat protein [Candidatus Neomarinimicrobiota bacterium]